MWRVVLEASRQTWGLAPCQTKSVSREGSPIARLERIQTLAANQDLLIRNKWHGVDVKDPRSAPALLRTSWRLGSPCMARSCVRTQPARKASVSHFTSLRLMPENTGPSRRMQAV
jgi:hypothetical protein